MEIIITDYARLRMKEREIEKEMVIKTLNSPEVIQPAHSGRYAHDLYPFSSKKVLNLCKVFSLLQKWKVCSSYINTFPRDVKKVKKLQKKIGGGDEKK